MHKSENQKSTNLAKVGGDIRAKRSNLAVQSGALVTELSGEIIDDFLSEEQRSVSVQKSKISIGKFSTASLTLLPYVDFSEKRSPDDMTRPVPAELLYRLRSKERRTFEDEKNLIAEKTRFARGTRPGIHRVSAHTIARIEVEEVEEVEEKQFFKKMPPLPKFEIKKEKIAKAKRAEEIDADILNLNELEMKVPAKENVVEKASLAELGFLSEGFSEVQSVDHQMVDRTQSFVLLEPDSLKRWNTSLMMVATGAACLLIFFAAATFKGATAKVNTESKNSMGVAKVIRPGALTSVSSPNNFIDTDNQGGLHSAAEIWLQEDQNSAEEAKLVAEKPVTRIKRSRRRANALLLSGVRESEALTHAEEPKPEWIDKE